MSLEKEVVLVVGCTGNVVVGAILDAAWKYEPLEETANTVGTQASIVIVDVHFTATTNTKIGNAKTKQLFLAAENLCRSNLGSMSCYYAVLFDALLLCFGWAAKW
jgi:hypothetical protein